MLNGGLAQLGEHLPYKQEVTGSSPVSSIESLAQLVEHLTFNQRVGSSSLPRLIGPEKTQAGVAELADALDLGSSVNRCAGSSPVTRTKRGSVRMNLSLLFMPQKPHHKAIFEFSRIFSIFSNILQIAPFSPLICTKLHQNCTKFAP